MVKQWNRLIWRVFFLSFVLVIGGSFTYLLFQWEFYLEKGGLSSLYGVLVGFLVSGLLLVADWKLCLWTSRGDEKDQDSRIGWVFSFVDRYRLLLIGALALSVVGITLVLVVPFNLQYVYARWYDQEKMNGIILQVSAFSTLLICTGVYLSVFPERLYFNFGVKLSNKPRYRG